MSIIRTDLSRFPMKNKDSARIAGSAQNCRHLQKPLKFLFFFCFPLILSIKSSLQMCCNRTICFEIQIIKFKCCCNSMNSQAFPNFKTQLSPKDEVGSYENIALSQRYVVTV